MTTWGLYADRAQLAAIREFAARAGREAGLEGQALYDLQLAVDEACTNVVEHAYEGQGGEIRISVEAIEGGVRVVIRDWGRPFEPGAIGTPDVTAPLEGRKLGGLGLFLMRQVMDEVDFVFDPVEGNRLTMVKRIR